MVSDSVYLGLGMMEKSRWRCLRRLVQELFSVLMIDDVVVDINAFVIQFAF